MQGTGHTRVLHESAHVEEHTHGDPETHSSVGWRKERRAPSPQWARETVLPHGSGRSFSCQASRVRFLTSQRRETDRSGGGWTRAPQTGCFKRQEFIVSQFCKLYVQDHSVSRFGFFSEPLSLACRWLSLRVLTWSSLSVSRAQPPLLTGPGIRLGRTPMTSF